MKLVFHIKSNMSEKNIERNLKYFFFSVLIALAVDSFHIKSEIIKINGKEIFLRDANILRLKIFQECSSSCLHSFSCCLTKSFLLWPV